MSEQRLRDELRQTPIDDGARARALGVVRAAFLEGEPVRPRRRAGRPRSRPSPARWPSPCVAVSVTEPGDAVARWVKDMLGVGREDARPALVRVPGGGRLLVTADGGRGAWVVSADGSRRRLGDYAGASWSPHGRFVVAWRGGELLAVEPDGRVRWSLARDGRIAAARWSRGLGYRVAYVSGRSLRVVNGDGTGDRRYAAASAVAPAWRPDGAARARLRGSARPRAGGGRRLAAGALAVGAGRRRERARLVARRATGCWWRPPTAGLVLSADGLVLAREPRGFVGRRRRLVTARPPHRRRAARVRRAATSCSSTPPAAPAIGCSSAGRERFGRVAFSPDGRRLLVPWPEADQWLFVSPAGGGRVDAVANIGRQFASGRRASPFPDAIEWCCAGS